MIKLWLQKNGFKKTGEILLKTPEKTLLRLYFLLALYTFCFLLWVLLLSSKWYTMLLAAQLLVGVVSPYRFLSQKVLKLFKLPKS